MVKNRLTRILASVIVFDSVRTARFSVMTCGVLRWVTRRLAKNDGMNTVSIRVDIIREVLVAVNL